MKAFYRACVAGWGGRTDHTQTVTTTRAPAVLKTCGMTLKQLLLPYHLTLGYVVPWQSFISISHVFSNESSSGLWKKMHNHTGCICSSSLHCVFSCDPLKRSHKRMQSHIDHIYLVLLCCVFSYAPLNRLLVKMKNYIGCNGLTFPRRVLSNGPLNGVAEKSYCHICCTCKAFSHYVFSNELSDWI